MIFHFEEVALNFSVNLLKRGGVLGIERGTDTAGIAFEKIEIEEIFEDTKSYLFKNKNSGIEVWFYDLDKMILIEFYSNAGRMVINEKLEESSYYRIKSFFDEVYKHL